MKRYLTSAAFAWGAAVLLGLAAGHARADGPVPAACASAPCETACLKKVCVPGTDVQTTTRRVYGEACEDFCLPKCSLGGGLGGLFHHKDHCDAGCADGACGNESCASCEHHVRTKKALVVRLKKEEEVVNKCSVGYAPEEAKCEHKLFGHKKECADGACLPPAEGCASAPGTIHVVPPPPAKMPPADGKGEKVPAPKEK